MEVALDSVGDPEFLPVVDGRGWQLGTARGVRLNDISGDCAACKKDKPIALFVVPNKESHATAGNLCFQCGIMFVTQSWPHLGVNAQGEVLVSHGMPHRSFASLQNRVF